MLHLILSSLGIIHDKRPILCRAIREGDEEGVDSVIGSWISPRYIDVRATLYGRERNILILAFSYPNILKKLLETYNNEISVQDYEQAFECAASHPYSTTIRERLQAWALNNADKFIDFPGAQMEIKTPLYMASLLNNYEKVIQLLMEGAGLFRSFNELPTICKKKIAAAIGVSPELVMQAKILYPCREEPLGWITTPEKFNSGSFCEIKVELLKKISNFDLINLHNEMVPQLVSLPLYLRNRSMGLRETLYVSARNQNISKVRKSLKNR